jgi:hypothetical protein
MAVNIKLGSDIVWGSSTAGTLVCGKILSCNSESGGKEFEQEDEDGETYSFILFDDREEIDVEVLAKTAQAKPARGVELAIAGVTAAIVTKSAEKWQAGQTKKFAISFRKYTG